MGKVIEKIKYQPSVLATEMMAFLNCPCECFAPMQDDDPLMEAFHEACTQGKKDGFTPILVVVDDTLWECLLMNVDPENERELFDASIVSQYRKRMLESTLPEGADCVVQMIADRKTEAEDDDLDWNTEVLGEVAGGEGNSSFAAYWNYTTELTHEVILAKIPTLKPWEIFAWLPFGGWNECPNTLELMAVTKYWYESHGAIPATLSHDELEFSAPRIINVETAKTLALEQYAFCPDTVDQCQQEEGGVGMLADGLTQSTVWYFWWD